MKRISLLLVAIGLFIGASAQITITSGDLLDVGDTIQLASVDSIPPDFGPGPAGPDQHWNFSNLVMDTTTRLSFIEPAATPYGESFPNSNIAVEGMADSFGAEGWAYATKNIFLFQIDGFGGSYDIFEDVIAPFNPPEVMFDFPVNYLDSLLQTTVMDIRLVSPEPPADSVRVKIVSTVDSKVDAWGEVMTPVWTGDVLRFRDVRTTIDSSWVKIFFIWVYLETNTTISVDYKYMANDLGYPALQFSEDTSGTEYSSVNYLLGAGVGNRELYAENEIAFDIYPNPASAVIYCRMQQAEVEGELLIYDITGREMDKVMILPGTKQYRVDVSTYPSGLYQFVITADERVVSAKKFIVR